MQTIGFAVFPGFQVMNFAAASVFEFANYSADKPLYDLRFFAEDSGPIRSSIGMSVQAERFGDPAGLDTLIVGGSMDSGPPQPALIAYLQRAVIGTRRVASICTGAYALAAAGLLDGRRVTTHWAHARDLQARFPKVKVEEDRIFIVDGPIWTSAGMTAGVDLALAMLEEDHGPELAKRVAKKLVVFHRRAGGQSQFSVMLDLQPKSDRIQSALTYAKQNLRSDLSVDELAEAAHLSPRQFSRAFRSETGQSPAKAVENLRVEAARLLTEQGRLPMDVVAKETGFADPERMRRAFLRAFGQPPQVIRRNARVETSA